MIKKWRWENEVNTGNPFWKALKRRYKLGIFLVGLGVFGQTVLEWLRFFRFKPRRERCRDFDWDEMLFI